MAIAGGIGGLSVGKALRLIALSRQPAGASRAASAAADRGGRLRSRGRTRRTSAWAAGAVRRSRSRRSSSTTRSRCSPVRARPASPGHGAISAAPRSSAALAAIRLAVAVYGRLRCAPRRARGRRARWRSWRIGADAANRFVLPRLYGWFHATLALVTVALLVLARAAARRRAARRRLPPAAAIVACCAAARPRSTSCAPARSCATPRTSARRWPRWSLRGVAVDAAVAHQRGGRAPRRRGRAAAAARRPAPSRRRRPADHHRRAPRRSRRRLRLPARDHAQHRRAGRARRALRARLRAGAAHVVLGGVDADGQVLPDAGPPGARRAPRADRGGAAHVRLADGGVLSAGGVLRRRAEAEGLRGHATSTSST